MLITYNQEYEVLYLDTLWIYSTVYETFSVSYKW